MAKNRVHLDLVPEGPRDAAVDEILALGATLVADHRNPDGTGWAVVADLEGNEFCVERSTAERGHPEPGDGGERSMSQLHTLGERHRDITGRPSTPDITANRPVWWHHP